MDENSEKFTTENGENISDENLINWLIFKINEKFFAVESDDIKEILKNSSIYNLPFVPDYVDGVLNRYGEPYAAIDPSIILGEKKQQNNLFLVFNDENKMAVRITDVVEFFSTKTTELKKFADNNPDDFYEGSFIYNQENVLVLRKDSLEKKVREDLGNA